MLTVRQVTARLGHRHPHAVLRLLATGQLRGANISTGKRPCWRVDPDELERFLSGRMNSPPQPPEIKTRRKRKLPPLPVRYF